jgi:ectoine hydroxylase-related dioxygenase (phytanoyl-CoA dioxygenase family)
MMARFLFDRKKFNEEGVVHIPAFFKGEFLAGIQANINTLINDKSKMVDRSNSEHFFKKYQSTSYCFVNKLEEFNYLAKLAGDPLLKLLLQEIFPEGHEFHISLVQHNKSNEGQAIPWHQDVHHEKVTAGKMYNFLIYPFDIDAESGALHYVPGSHVGGRLPVGEPHDPIPGSVKIAPKAGDLIICDCLTFHRVNHNQTNKDRTSINIRFRSALLDPSLTTIGVYRNGQVNYAG